jgi:tyrosinase
MATIAELHARTIALLTQPSNELPISAAADSDAAPSSRFVLFFPDHQERALRLAREFMRIANEHPDDAGLEAVLQEAERAAQTENTDLVKYALMVFITHHPQGRRLPIPSLDRRYPTRVVPSNADVAAEGIQALGALGAEAQLDYFREDTAINDHHNKWHVVYPFSGQPNPANPSGPPIPKDRQGELFWYMHQQMLARYDHDRRAFGLPVTQPFDDYRAPIPEGYDANLEGYSHRAPNDVLRNVQLGSGPYTVAAHEARRDRLITAAQSGKLRKGNTQVPITPQLLGDTMEANAGSIDGPGFSPSSFYGHHHNFGHVLISALSDPGGPFPDSSGVMAGTDTAMRDPIFYRWHRHVDDIFFTWQQTLTPNDLAQGAAAAIIRPTDIITCLARDVPGASAAGFDGAAFGRTTFGGANWDSPPSSFPVATDTLRTLMREEELPQLDGSTVKKPYLDHEEFFYFLRVENSAAERRSMTVRIFLVATELADDRRMWIEMDKFSHTLEANERAVIFRPARHAAVVRKPARRPADPPAVLPPGGIDVNYCDCGWPYHLLLPRGLEAGMPCRLLVMLTDHQADLAGAEKKCGSMSFCGARDALYPDRRRMGYPFDRPFAGSVTQALSGHAHVAARDITITHG